MKRLQCLFSMKEDVEVTSAGLPATNVITLKNTGPLIIFDAISSERGWRAGEIHLQKSVFQTHTEANSVLSTSATDILARYHSSFLTQTPTCNSDTTGYGSTVANVAHAHFKKVVSVFFLQQVYLEVFGCEVAAAHAGHSSAFRCKGFYLGVHSSFSLSMCCLFFGVMLSFKRLP